MKASRVLMLAAAMMLCVAAMTAGGCADAALDVEAKAKLVAALTEYEFSASTITATLMANADATAATQVKAAKEDLAAKWQKVIAAAKDVEGADVEAAEEAWTNAEEAIDRIPASASVAEAAAALSAPLAGVKQAADDLWGLVGSVK